MVDLVALLERMPWSVRGQMVLAALGQIENASQGLSLSGAEIYGHR